MSERQQRPRCRHRWPERPCGAVPAPSNPARGPACWSPGRTGWDKRGGLPSQEASLSCGSAEVMVGTRSGAWHSRGLRGSSDTQFFAEAAGTRPCRYRGSGMFSAAHRGPDSGERCRDRGTHAASYPTVATSTRAGYMASAGGSGSSARPSRCRQRGLAALRRVVLRGQNVSGGTLAIKPGGGPGSVGWAVGVAPSARAAARLEIAPAAVTACGSICTTRRPAGA